MSSLPSGQCTINCSKIFNVIKYFLPFVSLGSLLYSFDTDKLCKYVAVRYCVYMYVYEGTYFVSPTISYLISSSRCSSVVRAFAHGAIGRRIDHSWGGPIELYLVPASAPRLV